MPPHCQLTSGASSFKRVWNRSSAGCFVLLKPGAKKAPGKKRKLDESGRKLLEEDLHARPSATYVQRATLLNALLGVRVSKSTICRTIKRLGYTRKKDQPVRVREMSGSEQPGGQ